MMTDKRYEDGHDGDDRASESQVADREDDDFNPFEEDLNESYVGRMPVKLPRVENDAKWRYSWVRISIGGQFDATNLSEATADPRFEKELCPPDEYPALKQFVCRQKNNMVGRSYIGISDVALFRQSMKRWLQYQEVERKRGLSENERRKEAATSQYKKGGRGVGGIKVYNDTQRNARADDWE